MPYKSPILCLKCGATESSFWTNAENLGVICLNCVNEAKKDSEKDIELKEEDNRSAKKKNRTTRCYKTRNYQNIAPKSTSVSRGRGRRGLLKRSPLKAPPPVLTTVTSNFVFYKGSYIQVGDIVSMEDADNDIYYAQVLGLMTDQYCNKSAVIQWLLPSTESPPPNEGFDPQTYIIGPAEDLPRSLEFMEFVMHAPSDYYMFNKTPHSTVVPLSRSRHIWTSMKPVQQ